MTRRAAAPHCGEACWPGRRSLAVAAVRGMLYEEAEELHVELADAWALQEEGWKVEWRPEKE